MLKMIVTDVTYVMDTSKHAWGPVIRIWGRTKDGQHVCVKIRDFEPYFYIAHHNFDQAMFLDTMREKCKTDQNRSPNGYFIKRLEVVQRTTIMGYQPGGPQNVFKMTMEAPTQIVTAKNFFMARNICTYEANVLYVLRFMVDTDFGGCQWLVFDHISPCALKQTECPLEFDATTRSFRVDEADQDLGHLRRLSFDLEACKFSGPGFVDPTQDDPVTQIGCSVSTVRGETIDEAVFCLCEGNQGVAPLPDPKIRVFVCKNESELHYSFSRYIREQQIDIITGYNIDGFDFPYEFGRAEYLHLKDEFYQFTLEQRRKAVLKKAFFNSKAQGAREDYELAAEGRISMDAIKFFKKFFKLRSYGLGYVAEEFLEDKKVDMPYKLIPAYQRGTDEQRAHLAFYCWKDSRLVIDLLDKCKASIMYIQNARVNKVPMKYLVQNGQQILTLSLLLRYAQRRGFIIPSSTETQNDEKTKGAVVIDPIVGFYRIPVITLDFRSLYPSIMMCWNICYSTKVPKRWAEKYLKPADYYEVPFLNANYVYVADHIYLGIMPEFEQTLFGHRDDAKQKKAEAAGTFDEVVYDKLQEAIKLSMNSGYGFTKGNKLCDKDLMETICAFGRWMLETTKGLVESNFEGSRVIYGDTDSVFITFGDVTIEKALELGEKAASLVTAYLSKLRTDQGKKPVHLLQREKVFDGFLLVSKKKYAGNKSLGLGKPFKFSSSGLETVRRDNAKIGSGTLQTCLDNIILHKDYDGERSIAFVHDVVRKLKMGQIEYSELIISKGLSKSAKHYKESRVKQVHSELAHRIAERSHITGEQVYHTGDRVKFVMVQGSKNSKAFERSEDPLFALKNRTPIDFDYYIWNQMMKPLLRIFTPILAPHEKLKRLNSVGKMTYIPDSELMKTTAYKRLFVGPHMNRVVQRVVDPEKAVPGTMMSFLKKQKRCLGCSCGFSGDGAVCKHCEGKTDELKANLEADMQKLRDKQAACLQTCRECVKDMDATEIPCSNNDCDNYYKREKVVVDIEDLGTKLSRFY